MVGSHRNHITDETGFLEMVCLDNMQDDSVPVVGLSRYLYHCGLANRNMGSIGTTQYEVHGRTGWRKSVCTAAISQLAGSSQKKNVLDTNVEEFRNVTPGYLMQRNYY